MTRAATRTLPSRPRSRIAMSLALFRSTASGLAAVGPDVADQIVRRFEEVMLRSPGEGELRSWRNSLPALASLLVDAGLGGVEILIEYRLPLTSKRADAVLVGTGERGAASVLVCELKQWSVAEIEGADGTIVRVARRELRTRNNRWPGTSVVSCLSSRSRGRTPRSRGIARPASSRIRRMSVLS